MRGYVSAIKLKEGAVKLIFRILILLSLLTMASCGVTRPTVTQIVANPAVFMVSHPLEYRVGDSDHVIVVPVGFLTDLASIPEPLWWWESPHQGTMAPAIVHDYLYWEQPCSKDEADAVMYLAMRDIGMSHIDAYFVYLGIRTPMAQAAWDENIDKRAKGETRFFKEPYARKLQSSYVNGSTTIESVQADAVKADGLYKPWLPRGAEKVTCKVAYQEFTDS